jgi:hypothetical protein
MMDRLKQYYLQYQDETFRNIGSQSLGEKIGFPVGKSLE